MASKYAARQYQIPAEYPDILTAFTREVLRVQPANIYEFGVRYFDRKAQGLPDEGEGAMAPQLDTLEGLTAEEVEHIIVELFEQYDEDQNGFLDPREFKKLMNDLQNKLQFPEEDIYKLLAEADRNKDDQIEYKEFIPLAQQIVMSLYAKTRLGKHADQLDAHAESLLVHGMSRVELTEVVERIFQNFDTDGSGTLSHAEFVEALKKMELGLTRREINTIRFQVDSDQDGNISYREFIPFAFDLLHKLTALRLLEQEVENDSLVHTVTDLFRSRDVEMTGLLAVEDVRDLLASADLGLSRLQIYTVLSEAQVNSDGEIAYANFVPRAVQMIRSMLKFENSILHEPGLIGAEAEAQFMQYMDDVLSQLGPACEFMVFKEAIEGTSLEFQEQNLILNSAVRDPENNNIVNVAETKRLMWPIVKQLRKQRPSSRG
eukprot:CAMPEP_0204320682 /NCGR_PEP_ID=MMETSP0469-20131031/7762_1 /ASSEMBLY_ACC=CAM_ASM_000384 /TAXON_ID=2969 /ORGANISM="Oxyrrhis marina" /LENGTH=431 /DNA_ID=CAMNT_0051301947 /DNA_START=15 /DNA_END=1310 /DNA_ORIENTATION=+